jgi:hypothetical protein
MASKRRNVAMGAKRKQLASSSDDEKDQSDTPNDDDEDNKPLFRFSPSYEKAPVAKEEDNHRRLESGAIGWPIC